MSVRYLSAETYWTGFAGGAVPMAAEGSAAVVSGVEPNSEETQHGYDQR